MFGEYTPLMKAGLLQRRLLNRKAEIDPELGLQKLCPHCQEFWPQDTLFWAPSHSEPDGLQCWCKACQLEYKNSRRKAA
ncbi:hypothetical protein K6U40_14560 [Vibrio fluvialis]|uniref:hypothetical protein n=1 Tax=Vibrio fluvialis TaxID=676 RepID=UPI001EEB1314|nr:hypothetical protein [Vibrio fluvialis]MCG6346704.1 hypothetical protein [Vibrio fluvialis]